MSEPRGWTAEEWRAYAKAEIGEAREERDEAIRQLLEAHDQLASEREHTAALTALISWIDGACVDELPYMEIRAAIRKGARI